MTVSYLSPFHTSSFGRIEYNSNNRLVISLSIVCIRCDQNSTYETGLNRPYAMVNFQNVIIIFIVAIYLLYIYIFFVFYENTRCAWFQLRVGKPCRYIHDYIGNCYHLTIVRDLMTKFYLCTCILVIGSLTCGLNRQITQLI
jgi:hypothetical protein